MKIYEVLELVEKRNLRDKECDTPRGETREMWTIFDRSRRGAPRYGGVQQTCPGSVAK